MCIPTFSYSHTWKISTVHSYFQNVFNNCEIHIYAAESHTLNIQKIQIQPCDKYKAWSLLQRSILTKKQNLSHACLEKYRRNVDVHVLSTYHSSPTMTWSRSNIYWLQTSASKLPSHPLSFTGQFHQCSPITTLSGQTRPPIVNFTQEIPQQLNLLARWGNQFR